MEVQILIVLVIFMALFMGGGVLVVKGLLTSQPKMWILGILMIGLCLVFMYILKTIPGLY